MNTIDAISLLKFNYRNGNQKK